LKEVLMYFKETDKKYRWDADIDGTNFELYIPKWRVPKNVPHNIKVTIYFPPYLNDVPKLTPDLAMKEPDLCTLPIISKVHHHSNHNKTIRYDPIDQNDAEIGSPYIPFQLLPNETVDNLLICVQWL
jgi:hypothetical protein